MAEEKMSTEENLPISAAGLVVSAERAETAAFDIETVKKAIAGDRDAFTALFRKTYRQMYFVARDILQNDEDIYDALQIGYAKAYKFIHRLAAPEAFYVWLTRTVENAAKDVWRDVYAHEGAGWIIEGISAEEDATKDSDRRTDVDRALEQLEPALCEVLTLYYYDGLKLKDIAALLGETVSVVHHRLQTAKSRLKDILHQQGIDDAMYSGGIGTMIAVALRSLIGTDILSAAVAQKMLDDILNGKNGKLGRAAYVLIKQQRNRAVLRATALLMALCVGVSLLAVALTRGFSRVPSASAGITGTTASTATGLGALTQSGGTVAVTTTISGATGTSHTGSSTTPTGTTTQIGGAVQTNGATQTSGAAQTSGTQRIKTVADTAAKQTTTTGVTDGFVPDYRAGHANTAGRSANSVLDGHGLLTEQDGWLYYIQEYTLLKFCTDGADKQIIAELKDEADQLNVVGDWLYYVSAGVIWRIRTDGSKKESLAVTDAYNMRVIGDNIYFYKENKMWCLNVQSRKMTAVFEGIPSSFTTPRPVVTENELLFYVSSASDIRMVDLNTGEQRCLFEAARGCSFVLDEKTGTVYATYNDAEKRVFALHYTDPNAKATVAATMVCELPDGDWRYSTSDLICFSAYQGGALGYRYVAYNDSDYEYVYFSVATLDGDNYPWKIDGRENNFGIVAGGSGVYVFDSAYMYYIDESTLYRALPDGTAITAIA